MLEPMYGLSEIDVEPDFARKLSRTDLNLVNGSTDPSCALTSRVQMQMTDDEPEVA
jgi:hypothetical protein